MPLENPYQDSESIRNQRNPDNDERSPNQQISTGLAKLDAPPTKANCQETNKYNQIAFHFVLQQLVTVIQNLASG